MITGLKNTFKELLGNIGRFFYIRGPYGTALRDGKQPGGEINIFNFTKHIDIVDGVGTGGEDSVDWKFALLRAKELANRGTTGNARFDFYYEYDTSRGDGKGGGWNLVPTVFDLCSRVALIEWSGKSSDLPVLSTIVGQYGVIHTTEGDYTAGQILYCRQTGVSTYELIHVDRNIVGHIVTTDAVSGDITLTANWLYSWEGGEVTGSWVKKCVDSGGTMGVRCIRRTFGYGSYSLVSATEIPQGAVVLKTEVVITTAFNGDSDSDVTVLCNSQTLFSANRCEPRVAGVYNTEEKVVITAQSPVSVTVMAGGSTAGGGYALVWFVEPEE